MTQSDLFKWLKESSRLDEKKLKEAQNAQKEKGGRILSTLIDGHFIEEDELADFIAQKLDLQRYDLSKNPPTRDAEMLLDALFCRISLCHPIRRDLEKETLLLAVADPSIVKIKEIEERTKLKPELEIAKKSTIDTLLIQLEFKQRPMQKITGPFPRLPNANRMGYPTHHDTYPIDPTQDFIKERIIELREEIAWQNRQIAHCVTRHEFSSLLTENEDLRLRIERDEKVIQRLLGVLVDAGIFSREEIIDKLFSNLDSDS